MSKEYVIVTTVSHFRHKYCIPVDELRAQNPNATDEQFNAIEWAKDSVTVEEVQEFSQAHISEDIVDTRVVSEQEMLTEFDRDNDYLRNWSEQQKIDFVHRWKSNHS